MKRSRLRLLWLANAASAHTQRWVRALSARGHQIFLLSLTDASSAELDGIPNVVVESMGIASDIAHASDGSMRKWAYARAVPRVRRVFRSFRPDLCHAHYASSYGVIGLLTRVRPLVVSIWGADVYTTPTRSPLHRWVVARVLREADAVLSTSDAMKRHALGLVDRDISVVPFGVDVQRFSPVSRRAAAFTVGAVKSLERKYGIDHLLRAFARLLLLPDLAGSRLVLAGTGSQRDQLLDLARELGILDSVEFLGAVDNSRVHEVHQRFDVGVYPSVDESESFGVSVVETQACGVPVVVTRVGGLPEVVAEGVSGLVVEPRCEEALSDAIIRILRHPELRLGMGEEGRRRVLREYDLDRCIEKLEDRYAELVDDRLTDAGVLP